VTQEIWGIFRQPFPGLLDAFLNDYLPPSVLVPVFLLMMGLDFRCPLARHSEAPERNNYLICTADGGCQKDNKRRNYYLVLKSAICSPALDCWATQKATDLCRHRFIESTRKATDICLTHIRPRRIALPGNDIPKTRSCWITRYAFHTYSLNHPLLVVETPFVCVFLRQC
jgi:hypothetical protein